MKSYLIILSYLLCLGCENASVEKEKGPAVKTNAQGPTQFRKGFNANFRLNYPNFAYMETGIFGAEAYFRAEDDLETAFLEEAWLGIFKTKDNWYLNPVKPKVETVFDGIVDDIENDTNNWSGKIMTTAKNCIFTLKRGALNPKKLKVLYASKTNPSFHDEKSVLLPGDTLQFEVNGIHYWLYAKGKLLPKEEGLYDQRYANYGLYLQTDDPGQAQQVQLLRSVAPEYEYGPNRLVCLFVGLLDADQIPDFIISSSFEQRILYLSGEAKEQRIVEPIYMEPMTGGC
ncbi:MAG: hypothetical protein ACKOWX_08230 [Flavobacteriales bacterium]